MVVSTGDDSSETNKPRNHLVTDATQPFEFTYQQYGKPAKIVVQQTPNEDTWPGGALWDIGVLLSHTMLGLASGTVSSSSKSVTLPKRLFEAIESTNSNNKADWTVLELGCGVGLTGLVAAAALGTQLTILTDLQVVIDQVTQPNLESNSSPSSDGKNKPYRLMNAGKRGRVMAMPLCWGVEVDERAVAAIFQQNTKLAPKSRVNKNSKKKKGGPDQNNNNDNVDDISKPSLIIIGDVAYQHKPGAPSHFDVLVSTLLKFLGQNTLVVFGTRMRMPASADLLEMFSKHMEECCEPIPADEIDQSFGKFKHQITIHVFRKRREENVL
jgi:predicted nicotinamide N-methyase